MTKNDMKQDSLAKPTSKGDKANCPSMEEYIEMCSQFGAQAGMTNEEMKAYCEKLFPMLKRWKK